MLRTCPFEDLFRLSLCRISPEQEDHRSVLLGECADHRIGELLPSVSRMGIRLMLPHCQHGVEQQHSLLRPTFQIIFIREGGICTPSGTENASPIA